jgi:hypothetical protein
MKRFRGVAHVHSTYSFDGRLTLDSLVEFLRERGVDFVLMSEHVESLDPAKIKQFIEHCEQYSDGSFQLIPGIEIDALHALFYSVQPVSPWTSDEALARQLAAGGAIVAVSHPVKVKKDIPHVTAELAEAVEVWNSRHDGKLAPSGRIIRFWRVLQRRLGRQLVPICGIDFHKPDDFIPLMFEVTCDTLERDSVMAAIREGHYTILRGRKEVPLNFATGTLAPGYRIYSTCYRLVYETIYTAHRTALRLGLRAPRGLRGMLRRVF